MKKLLIFIAALALMLLPFGEHMDRTPAPIGKAISVEAYAVAADLKTGEAVPEDPEQTPEPGQETPTEPEQPSEEEGLDLKGWWAKQSQGVQTAVLVLGLLLLCVIIKAILR